MFLENIGAGEQLRHLFHPYAQQGLQLGRICFASHEQYSVFLEDGLHDALPTGRLRFDDTLPAVGDWVAARKVDQTLALIEEVLPRRTQFSRRAAGTAKREQVIAANIDLAVIVCGLDHDYNLRRLERYLVLTQESGADALVVLNKSDLCAEREERAAEVRAIAPAVLLLSACESVAALLPLIKDKTVALLGSSGAGKSTIANALIGENKQATAAVREYDSRGRHTTTSRMLIPLPDGGALIDNPGMRELQLWASEESLDDVFAEITALAQNCHFADCTHHAEPKCAVQTALAAGVLDPARWEGYQKLARELRYQQRSNDTQVMLAEKQKWKAIHKAMRHHPKNRR